MNNTENKAFYTVIHPIMHTYTCKYCDITIDFEKCLAHFPASNDFVRKADYYICASCSQQVV